MKELRVVLLFSAVFLFSLPLKAGTPAPEASARGAVAGDVHTSDGLALPGVRVELDGPAGAVWTTTGPDGRFRVPGLVPGEYSAAVDAPGLVQRVTARVVVATGETSLPIVLAPAAVSEQVVVSATRSEATLSTLGVAASVLDRERIALRAAPDLVSLLQELPGIATSRTGGTGLQASVFIRGGEARYARVLVDGVPVNQPGGAYDFGTALPFELERVELVRGAASSLYGSDALAGVVSLETRRARPGESPSLRAEAEAGSFAWQRGSAATSGAKGALDWNLGVQRLRTDNEQPNGGFRQTSVALASGLRLDSTTELRGVFRLDDGTVGTPGQTAFGRPDLDARFDRTDIEASLALRRAGPRLAQRLAFDLARTDQLSRNPLDSGPWLPEWNGQSGSSTLFDYVDPDGYQNRTARLSARYQADASVGTRQLLSAGAEAEHETGEIGSRSAPPLLSPSRDSFGVFAQDRVLLGSHAYLTVGGRVERNGSYGTRAVPRAALALRLRGGPDATTLRASAGLGIKEPSFLESYGEFSYARGNPNLKPERSATFDLGVEQRLLGSRVRASLTAFQHTYRDQIAYTVVDFTTFEGTYVNLARTRSRGLECELEARPLASLQLAFQYTFQDGQVLESPNDFDPLYAVGKPLLRRPRHQASGSASYAFRRGSLGVAWLYVGERADSDFLGLELKESAAHTRFDARLRLQLAGPLEAFLVAENLSDAHYQEVLGYPALGRSLRGGLRLRLGGRP